MDKILIEKMVEIFKTPKNFNWAWQYYSDIIGDWVQFDCPECLQLEFYFQALRISGLDAYMIVETIIGIVNLQTLELIDHCTKTVYRVRRTLNNIRKRPNAHRRHDPIDD